MNPAARAEFQQDSDPTAPTNRTVFGANQYVGRNALQPVARSYQKNVPGAVRNSLRNFVGNLDQPAVLANDVL